MSERTTETDATVDEDDVRVEKSFTDDTFPVPAVTYTLSSTREEPVRVRIVDRIPESFPMDRIGFHPEYESENWTAYKDNRVEFERVIDPDETVETVFGIRDDDPDVDGFLGTPVIEHVPAGEEIEDVLGAGDTDAVREVLSGDRATLPGMADADDRTTDDATAEGRSDGQAAEPSNGAGAEPPDDAEPTVEPDAGSAGVETERPEDDDTDGETDGDDDEPVDETPPSAEAEAVEADVELAADESVDETPPSTEPAADESAQALPADGEFAAALAAEIRSGAADEADIKTIESALDMSVPRSVDVRIARLQSSVADIEAYADALSEFIDGEGTARDVLDGIDERVEMVESETDTLDDRLADAADERESMASDVADVTERTDGLDETVAAVEETLETVRDAVSDVEADVSDVEADLERVEGETDAAAAAAEDATERADGAHHRIDDAESTLDRFEEELDDLWDDLAELDSQLTDAEDRLDEDLDDVRAELDTVDDHLGELDEFRTRLSEAFGP